MIKLNLFLISILMLFFTSSTYSQANPQTVAESWLQLIDSGQFDQSWTDSSEKLKLFYDQFSWKLLTETLIAPYGNLISRTLASTETTTSCHNLPAGNYMVLKYNSSYTLKDTVVEQIILSEDTSGQWKVAMYNIK